MIQEIAIALLALFLILALMLAYEDDQFGGKLHQLKDKMRSSMRQTGSKLRPPPVSASRQEQQSWSQQAGNPPSTRTAIPGPATATQNTRSTFTAAPPTRRRPSGHRIQTARQDEEDQLRTARQSVVQQDLDEKVQTAQQGESCSSVGR
ncbi:hypothetical protein COOONC_15728 [Cooperia oncophora]